MRQYLDFSCGVKPSPRIVGGFEAEPYSIPWQVRLPRGCGATLIGPRHVMTAAHCGGKNFVNFRSVIVGEHLRYNDSDGTTYETCRFENHPEYVPVSMVPDAWGPRYDYSILHLKKPVEIGPRVVPACLPTSKHSGDFLAGKILTTSGWGDTLNETHDPSRLRFVKVPGITNLECQKWFNETDYLPYKVQIRPAELCAGEPDVGGKDACGGDSGGNI